MIGVIAALIVVVLYTLGSWVPQLAERAIKDELLKQVEAEHLDVKLIAAPPIRAVGGEIGAIQIEARGLKVEGIPVATLSIQTDALQSKPLFPPGPPSLLSPLTATASLVLTDQGLEDAFKSPRFSPLLRERSVQILPGMIVNLDIVPEDVQITPERIVIAGHIAMGGATIPFEAAGLPVLRGSDRIYLVNPRVTGLPISPRAVEQAAAQAPILDLSTLQLPVGQSVRFVNLSLSTGSIAVTGWLSLSELPN